MRFQYTQHWTEDFTLTQHHLRLHVSENCRRNEIAFVGNVGGLKSQRRFGFSLLDDFLNSTICGLIDHRTDGDSRLFRITNAQTGGSCEQSMHHPLVIFLEDDETRTGGTFLPLITESRVDRVDNGLIEIGIGIDNDRVLPAHLTDDTLELALARAGFAGRLPNSQTDFA